MSRPSVFCRLRPTQRIELLAFHPYGVDKSSTNLPGWDEGHLCRVADNTV